MKTQATVETGRRRVARSLLSDGPSTAADLARRLGITPAAVRKHLDALISDGLVQSSDRPSFGPSPKRGRGRPARFYEVTDTGRASFAQAYDDLAVSALNFLRQAAGEEAVVEFARSRAAEMEQRYAQQLVGIEDPAEQASRLADLLTEDGYAATCEEGVTGVTQLCQHHCPVGDAAHAFPELCDAEAQAFARLLGTNVTRLATLAHGDGVCTLLVSHQALVSARERNQQ